MAKFPDPDKVIFENGILRDHFCHRKLGSALTRLALPTIRYPFSRVFCFLLSADMVSQKDSLERLKILIPTFFFTRCNICMKSFNQTKWVELNKYF